MAILSSQNWWIRADGNVLNGGGFDSTISGAGTNYSDQASPQLSLVDLTSTNSTTITSIVGGFTAAMVGNILRISSGAGATTGYYMVTTHTDTNTITVDRVSGTYTVGVGRIGGAAVSIESFMTTGNGGLSTPTITSPIVAGNVINIRGAGTDDPTTVDYDYKGTSTAGYYTCPNGNITDGRIRLIGYNGRPLLQVSGLFLYQANYWYYENIKFKLVTSASFPTASMLGDASIEARNLIYDLNGQDALGFYVGMGMDCEVRNLGGGAAGTGAAFQAYGYPGIFIGCYADSVRGDGFRQNSGSAMVCINCIARKSGRDNFRISDGTAFYGKLLMNCTADGQAVGSDGLEITIAGAIPWTTIANSIFYNSAGYGINCSVGSTALNDRIKGTWDYITVNGNTTAPRNNNSANTNDNTLDPTFTDAANENYTVGTNMKATGFPGEFNGSLSTGYMDRGAVQREEVAGGGGGGGLKLVGTGGLAG